MTVALIISAALVLVGALLYTHHRLTGGDASHAPLPVVEGRAADEECCGQHAVCERDSLLAAMSQKIEYYDDEELDVFAGREPESYSAAESEQFRDVLLTLLPDDIAGWARSVQLRGIALPIDVRDELIMMITEARASRTHA